MLKIQLKCMRKLYLSTILLSLYVISAASLSGQGLAVYWSFNQELSPGDASIDNVFGTPTTEGGFIGLNGFGAEGKTIGSPGDTGFQPDIGGVLNNNAMGASGARSILDGAGTTDASGTKGLTFRADMTGVSGGITVSWHASQSYLGSRYWQLEASTDGVNFNPVSGGTGVFTSESLGINGQTTSAASIDNNGLIDIRVDTGVIPSTTNGDAFSYSYSYAFQSGSAYENNANFAFRVVRIHDPSGSDYVSSFAGTLFGDTDGYTRSSAFFDAVKIEAGTVPEPSTIAAVMGAIALGLVMYRRRR
jgi:hypothetical protein